MPFNISKAIAFDVETKGIYDSRHALQPHRLRTGEAKITSSAIAWVEDGKLKASAQEYPDRAYHERMLRHAIDNKLVLVGWNMAFDAAWLCAQGLSDLVIQARWLDAMLLWQHLERGPEYFTAREKKKKWTLKDAVAHYFPKFAGYGEGIDFQSDDPAVVKRRLNYNKMDVGFTLRLAQMFYNDLEQEGVFRLRNALIEADTIPLVADRTVQGLSVDKAAALKLDEVLIKRREEILEELTKSGATAKILASPKQLAAMMYEDWGLPVLKTTDKGAPSTDKEAMYMLAAHDDRAPLIQEFREAHLNRKKFVTNVLESVEYNGDGKTRPVMRIYGTYCVPGDTEVLTREGWVPIEQWAGGEIVQCTDKGEAFFKHADRFDGPEVTDWVSVSHRRLTARFTLGHTVPYYDQAKNWRTMPAERMVGRHHQDLPVAAVLKDSFLPAAQTRVIVAALADGWFNPEKGTWKWTLKKERKKLRLEELLTASGVQFRTCVCSAYPERTEYTINKRAMPLWLRDVSKTMGPWVLDHNPAVWVGESLHWDGSHTDGGYKVVYKDRENASWMATLAALAGMKGSLHAPEKQRHGGETTAAHVSTTRRPIVCVQKKNVALTHTAPEKCYCPKTETGYWLARTGDHVYVTGNTGRATFSSAQGRNKDKVQTGFALHQMKNDADFRNLVSAPPGFVIVEWDAASQEYRWMATESNDEVMLSLCMPGEDPHSFMGSRIGHVDYHWLMEHKDSDKEAKKIRKGGKVGNLSCQYRIGYRTLRIRANVNHGLPIDDKEAKVIHKTYHATYKGVEQYWRRQIRKCKRLGYAETLAGRRVQLTGQWSHRQEGWKLESTAVNFPIQGIGADQKYLAMKLLKNVLPQIGGHFYFELHDGLYAILPEKTAVRDGIRVRNMLSNMPYKKAWGFEPPVPMPWDMKIGSSWGSMTEVNE